MTPTKLALMLDAAGVFGIKSAQSGELGALQRKITHKQHQAAVKDVSVLIYCINFTGIDYYRRLIVVSTLKRLSPKKIANFFKSDYNVFFIQKDATPVGSLYVDKADARLIQQNWKPKSAQSRRSVKGSHFVHYTGQIRRVVIT